MCKTFLFVLMLSAVSLITAQNIKFIGKPELVLPHLVSTEKSEIKLTFSPDGTRMLWGTIGWENGIGGWDIWESVKENNQWGKPKPVSFNSSSNDFDHCFSFDGKGVYFFSNREGGFGKHDIFTSKFENGNWLPAVSIGEPINSPLDDFDPAFLSDGKTIVFASERAGNDAVDLYVSEWKENKYSTPVILNSVINSKDFWDFGCSVNPKERNVLYYNSHNPNNGVGKVDVYKIKYVIH